jgi:hypothetical protein
MQQGSVKFVLRVISALAQQLPLKINNLFLIGYHHRAHRDVRFLRKYALISLCALCVLCGELSRDKIVSCHSDKIFDKN